MQCTVNVHVYILFVPHREAYTSIEVYAYGSMDSLAITPSVREGGAMENRMCRINGMLSGICCYMCMCSFFCFNLSVPVILFMLLNYRCVLCAM